MGIPSIRKGKERLTLLRKHEIVEGVHVLLIRFCIVLLDVFINGTLDDLNGSLRVGERSVI